MKKFVYKNPSSLDEALSMLGKSWKDAKILAGGVDLVGMMKNDNVSPESVVNIKNIKNLNYINNDLGGIRIGSLTKIVDLEMNPAVKNNCSLLSQAASVVGTPQIRNMGTIGGNICQRPRCWYFRGNFPCLRRWGDECSALIGDNRNHCIFGGDPCFMVHPSDIATALLALDAKVKIYGTGGTKTVSIGKFFILPEKNVYRENILKPDEIITEIYIPSQPDNSRQIYKKFMRRSAWDFAVASVAIVITQEGNKCKYIRLVLGGVAPVPWRVQKAENFLKGKELNNENIDKTAEIALEGAQPLEKNEYKIELTKNLIKDAFLSIK